MKEKLWSQKFILINIINFLVFANHFMILSTFPFFIEMKGGKEVAAGVLAGIFSIIAVLFRPFFGWLLDNRSRKIILIFGVFIMGFTSFSYIFISTLLMIPVIRLISGIGISCASTSSSTITSDIIPKSRFSEGMGIFGIAITLATALTPSIGLYLMQKKGFNSLFISSTIFTAVALFLIFFIKTDKRNKEFKAFKIKNIFEKNSIPAASVILLFMMTFGAIENFIAKYAATINLSGGIFFIFMAIAVLLSRLFLGKIADKKGEEPFVYLGNVVMLLGLIILAIKTTVFTFIISAILAGFGFGVIEPALMSLAIRNAKPERRGSANSTFLCAYDIGIGFGAGLAGFLITNLGYKNMFFIISIANIASIMLYLLLIKHKTGKIE